jgi:hypothetical protein
MDYEERTFPESSILVPEINVLQTGSFLLFMRHFPGLDGGYMVALAHPSISL